MTEPAVRSLNIEPCTLNIHLFVAIAFFLTVVITGESFAAPLPSRPTKYVKDDAGVLSPDTRQRIDSQLEQFERDTSSQVVVYVAHALPADEDLNSYANRIFRAWGIGQKKRDNGVLLAIFVDDHKLRIEVGRGLEGAIPDITCGHIMREDIEPHFKNGDYNGGVQGGVNAIIAAAKGEYKGTGKTRDESLNPIARLSPWLIALITVATGFIGLIIRVFTTPKATPNRALVIGSGFPVGAVGFPLAAALGFGVNLVFGWFAAIGVLMLLGFYQNRGAQYSSRGRSDSFGVWGLGGGSWGGSGGGGSSGGFTGGGGDSGGGGASGSW